MNKLALLVSFCVVFSGCGRSVRVGKRPKNLNDVPLSIAPPGGVYSFQPTVTVAKETTEKDSGDLRVRTPGDETFLSGFGLASNSAPEARKPMEEHRGFVCAEVAQSGDVEYYLAPGLFSPNHRSDLHTEHYDIQLPENPLTINGAALTKAAASCAISYDYTGRTLFNFTAQFVEGEGAKDDPTATLKIHLTNADAGKTFTIDWQSDDREYSVDLSLSAPEKDQNDISYATKPQESEWDGVVSRPKKHDGVCTISVDAFRLNGETHGTIACKVLPTFPVAKEAPAPRFGASATFSGSWSCDRY